MGHLCGFDGYTSCYFNLRTFIFLSKTVPFIRKEKNLQYLLQVFEWRSKMSSAVL